MPYPYLILTKLKKCGRGDWKPQNRLQVRFAGALLKKRKHIPERGGGDARNCARASFCVCCVTYKAWRAHTKVRHQRCPVRLSDSTLEFPIIKTTKLLVTAGSGTWAKWIRINPTFKQSQTITMRVLILILLIPRGSLIRLDWLTTSIDRSFSKLSTSTWARRATSTTATAAAAVTTAAATPVTATTSATPICWIRGAKKKLRPSIHI